MGSFIRNWASPCGCLLHVACSCLLGCAAPANFKFHVMYLSAAAGQAHIFCGSSEPEQPDQPSQSSRQPGHQLRLHHMTLHGYWSTERRSARYDTDDDARAARSSMPLSNKSRQQASMCSCCNANHRLIVQSTFLGIRKSCTPARLPCRAALPLPCTLMSVAT